MPFRFRGKFQIIPQKLTLKPNLSMENDLFYLILILKKTTSGTDACTEGTGALSLVTALGLAIHKITSNQEDITV